MKDEENRSAIIKAVQEATPKLRDDVFSIKTWLEMEELWLENPLDYQRINILINRLISDEKYSHELSNEAVDRYIKVEDIRNRWGHLHDYIISKNERPTPVILPSGCARALAAGPNGAGVVSIIETVRLSGSDQLILTGMEELTLQDSVKVACTLASNKFKSSDSFHVNFSDGLKPSSGSSAGIAFFLSLASLLTDKPLPIVAATGIVNLRGHVCSVGGIKEKLYEAFRVGIGKVLIPKENEKDIKRIPIFAQKELEIIPISTVDQALVAVGL